MISIYKYEYGKNCYHKFKIYCRLKYKFKTITLTANNNICYFIYNKWFKSVTFE